MAIVTFTGKFSVGSFAAPTTQVDLSAKIKSIKFPSTADVPDVSALGDTNKKFAKGLTDSELTVEFYYDPALWVQLRACLPPSCPKLDFTYGPDAPVTGNPKVTGTANAGGLILSKLDDMTSINQVKMLTATFKVNGAPADGLF